MLRNPNSILLCSANVRSAKSKSAELLNFVCSNDIDLFAIIETWLTDNDSAAVLEFSPGTQRRWNWAPCEKGHCSKRDRW